MNRENEIFEKEMLGKSLREMFFEMNVEMQERFQEIKNKFLEARIAENSVNEDIFVETVLVKKKNTFKMDGVFFPVVDKIDIFDDSYEDIYLENVYLNLDLRKIDEVLEREFLGWIDVDGDNYEIKVRIVKDERYSDEIRKLHNSFELNGKSWKTINMAHFMRCYKIKLSEYDFQIERDVLEKIQRGKYEITYDFEEIQDKVLRDRELLWNIEKKKIISTIFVCPTKIDVSFEYTINFEDNEQILVSNHENEDILCCYYSGKNKLNIISKKNTGDIWDVFSIKPIEKCRKMLEIYEKNGENQENYFHFTNFRNESFIDKIQKKNTNTRSRAFLEKYFLEYEFTKNEIILKDINFTENIEENLNIYDCDESLKNEFQKGYSDKKPKLNLFVEIKDFDEYSEDKVSFLISEIQNNYNEFECRGYLYGE
ncbi:hypothetical protein JMUB3935_1361 [Leptotrichia trevisanii]|uniref:Uncharacterized protein n=1 Tax=Leptotrichia trevisanii TaxID=109328 RepID=A0A510KQX5_9FUSO|nr:hypothetical protein [Leptotrichia trevisanii]BBM52383.1 hypothetical protein JMUB3935_1361 [Leptotrichia trevisanii]